MLVKV